MTNRREFLSAIPAAGAAFAVGGNILLEGPPARAETSQPLAGHFHPKGKAPSKFTIEILRQAKAGLPFDDVRDPPFLIFFITFFI